MEGRKMLPTFRARSDILSINVCTRAPFNFKCRPAMKGDGRHDSYNEMSSLRLGFVLTCREFPICLGFVCPVIGDRSPTFLVRRCYEPPPFRKFRFPALGVS